MAGGPRRKYDKVATWGRTIAPQEVQLCSIRRSIETAENTSNHRTTIEGVDLLCREGEGGGLSKARHSA